MDCYYLVLCVMISLYNVFVRQDHLSLLYLFTISTTRSSIMESNNYSIYAIHDPVERFACSTFLFSLLLASILGNTLILVATLRYNALTLDKITVTLITHIACSDLGLALTTILPRSVSMTADRLVFGEFLFVLRVYTGYFFYQASVFLVCALNISKLTCIMFGLQARLRSRRTGHLVGGMMWVLSLTWPIFFIFVNPRDLYFDYRVYVSNYAFTDAIWGRFMPVLGALLGTVPNLVVMVTTVWLLIVACRASRRTTRHTTIKWQGITTVCMIAVVYCVSNVPFTISILAEKSLTQYDSDGNPVGWFYIGYHRFAWNIVPLNNVGNVFIYTWSIMSFRRFVLTKVLRRKWHVNNGVTTRIATATSELGSTRVPRSPGPSRRAIHLDRELSTSTV